MHFNFYSWIKKTGKRGLILTKDTLSLMSWHSLLLLMELLMRI